MTAPTSDTETDTVLRWLVRVARFVVVPGADEERLELCRWWTGGWADRLILRAESDAELQRITGVDPREPSQGRLVCRDRRTVRGIAQVVQAWGRPSPTSCLLVVRLSHGDSPRPSTAPASLVPALAGECGVYEWRDAVAASTGTSV